MELKEAILDLQDQVNVTKEQINVDSEELKMMIRYLDAIPVFYCVLVWIWDNERCLSLLFVNLPYC